jgi:hypothetical protein
VSVIPAKASQVNDVKGLCSHTPLKGDIDTQRLFPGTSTRWTTNYTEVLKGDDYPLEYDANGYPELPAFLDRRQKALKEAA